MNSPWGYRGEICKAFGWTYEYLLWGISWLNVKMMLADTAKIDTSDSGMSQESERVEIKLETKDDLKKFITGD